VGFATPAVVLIQIDPICPKSGREFLEGIISRALGKMNMAALIHDITLPRQHEVAMKGT